MAQNTQTPFRREFVVSGGEYLENDEGIFIGNINSLRIELIQSIGDILVQGKIGRSGNWHTLYKNNSITLAPDLDVRAFEYIRIYVVPGSPIPTRCILIGSLALPAITTYSTVQSERDHAIAVENNILLRDIAAQLTRLCSYFEILIEDRE